MAGIRLTDGQLDFSAGVDSGRITTISSPANPHGLKRNQLAWLGNGTVRGGGISSRTGYQPRVQGAKWGGLYQGGYMYLPITGAFPYLVLDIGGRTYEVHIETDNSVKEITPSTPFNPALPKHYMVQAEQFLVFQDGQSEPRVYDGTTMRLISSMANASPKLPTGTAMDYYMGRIWVAGSSANGNGRQYVAGDIVRGPSGTAPYGLTDSVLSMVENTYLASGGAFVVPTNAGNIRAMCHNANLDTTLGQGVLFVGTAQQVYSVNVAPDRTSWIATNNTNQALQRVAQIKYGMVSDRSVVKVNGDLFYQTLEPGVRSLFMAQRLFNQWGNTAISTNEKRALDFTDRALLQYASGIEFNNRLLQTTLPFQSAVGVAHQGIMPLDFDIISNLESKLSQTDMPAWEGMLEGLDFLQLFEGDFGGLQRAFAVVYSRVSQKIEVWEMVQDVARDNGDNRIGWYFETPSLDGQNIFSLKELESLELWYDQLQGKVEFDLFYRPDQHPCWYFWNHWTDCNARDCTEDPSRDGLPCVGGSNYPGQAYCNGERPGKIMPKPVNFCNLPTGRPTTWGYQFQFMLKVKGSCRIRGYLAYMLPREKPAFEGLTCGAFNV